MSEPTLSLSTAEACAALGVSPSAFTAIRLAAGVSLPPRSSTNGRERRYPVTVLPALAAVRDARRQRANASQLTATPGGWHRAGPCAVCGAELHTHECCCVCGILVGPGHAESLTDGYCRACHPARPVCLEPARECRPALRAGRLVGPRTKKGY